MAHNVPSQPGAWYLDAAPATVSAWSLRLQWTRSAADAIVLVAALALSSTDFPLRRLAPLVAATALIHADAALRLRRGQSIPTSVAAGAIGLDILLLTGLLELSGGPSNPFSVVYAVAIALAGATLGGAWAWAIGLWAAVCYGVLISWHLEELVPSHHRLIDFPTHLFTMWLSVAVFAELAVHFVREASAAVARRETQLDAMRRHAARQERHMSLTTLAAGAAHELSTPLATIAVASHELERSLAAPNANESWTHDARLVREQVDRCHAILDQMSGRAGGHASDLAEPTDLASLFDDLRQRLPPEQARRVHVQIAPALSPVMVPRAGLSQVLLSLVKNAFDATDDRQPVTLEGIQQDRLIRLIVRDRGEGMTDEALRRAGEPFYTTKEPGRGMGLGLFLARMFAERCGGTLTLESNGGTTATLELPLSSGTPGTA